jgi:hypothetical protein
MSTNEEFRKEMPLNKNTRIPFHNNNSNNIPCNVNKRKDFNTCHKLRFLKKQLADF